MPVTPTKTLIVQTGENGVPVLAKPVRLVNPDGTDFTGSAAASVDALTGATTIGKTVMKATDAATVRKAIGTGTSSFSGSYADLTNKPTIPAAATWANLNGKPTPAAAIADLTTDAEPAAIATTVNKALAALRTFGVIAK